MDKGKKQTQIFSADEKRAYYMGVGIGAVSANVERVRKFMSNMPSNVKKSFLNGVDEGLLKRGVYQAPRRFNRK